MYSNALVPLSVPAGAVGIASIYEQQWLWFILAGFAIFAAGQAVARIVPRNGEL